MERYRANFNFTFLLWSLVRWQPDKLYIGLGGYCGQQLASFVLCQLGTQVRQVYRLAGHMTTRYSVIGRGSIQRDFRIIATYLAILCASLREVPTPTWQAQCYTALSLWRTMSGVWVSALCVWVAVVTVWWLTGACCHLTGCASNRTVS